MIEMNDESPKDIGNRLANLAFGSVVNSIKYLQDVEVNPKVGATVFEKAICVTVAKVLIDETENFLLTEQKRFDTDAAKVVREVVKHSIDVLDIELRKYEKMRKLPLPFVVNPDLPDLSNLARRDRVVGLDGAIRRLSGLVDSIRKLDSWRQSEDES